MSRRLCLASLALAACVGDAPPSKPSVQDAGTPTDSGTVDAGADTFTPPADAGTEAGPKCIASAPNLVSWWTGDDTLLDHQTSNNMTKAGSNGMVTFTAGHVGRALSFDGSGFLERPLPIGIASLGGLTVEAWVRASARANQRILDRSTAGDDDGWFFDLWQSHLRFTIGTASVSSKMEVPLDTTLHVAGTFDGSTLRVFVDGLEENQAAAGGVTTVPSPDHPLRLGGASDFSAVWSGFVDEAAIYSRALTPAEIKAIYDAGSAGRCK